MKIKIKCPICNANNSLSSEGAKNCRRCSEDLGLLYTIKAYSMKYRLYFVKQLLEKNPLSESKKTVQAAHFFAKIKR